MAGRFRRSGYCTSETFPPRRTQTVDVQAVAIDPLANFREVISQLSRPKRWSGNLGNIGSFPAFNGFPQMRPDALPGELRYAGRTCKPRRQFRSLNSVMSPTAYGGTQVLSGFNLQVQSGETLVLLGRSGSGKTTSLKLVNRLLSPTSGESV
jgi:ABC-type multidrug transport system fused ATPase/permease subunit